MSDSKSQIDPDVVRELAAILNETDLFEVEVRHGGQPIYRYLIAAE